jgi:hypothetical protein
MGSLGSGGLRSRPIAERWSSRSSTAHVEDVGSIPAPASWQFRHQAPVAADFRADSIDRERFSAGRAGPAKGKSANCQGRRTHLIKINA